MQNLCFRVNFSKMICFLPHVLLGYPPCLPRNGFYRTIKSLRKLVYNLKAWIHVGVGETKFNIYLSCFCFFSPSLVSSIQPVVSQSKPSVAASAAGEQLNKFEIDKNKQKEVSIINKSYYKQRLVFNVSRLIFVIAHVE